MSLTSAGLTDIGLGPGLTANFQVQYETSLGNNANCIANANALLAVLENEFTVTTGWFSTPSGSFGTSHRQVVNLNKADGSGANNSGYGSAINTDAQSGNSNHADAAERVKMLFMNEWVEILMSRGGVWNAGDSSGEGLSQFLGILRFPTGHYSYYGTPSRFFVQIWMNTTPRQDWVNSTKPTDSDFPSFGCALAFLFYLSTELGFTPNQIIAAYSSTLTNCYRNLTGDSGDPFPAFAALLESVYPSSATTNLPGPIFDNPFPLGILSFWVDKSTFGRDEVTDAIASSGGLFPNAFWLVLEGFNHSQFTNLGINFTFQAGETFTSLVTAPGTPDFENTTNNLVPQRIRIPYGVQFNSSNLSLFPPPGSETESRLDATANSGGVPVTGASAAADFELVGGEDPYFTNIDPAQNNVFYLSNDLRVFTATPTLNATPVTGGPTFGGDTFAGAYQYIQDLLAFLNNPANHFTDGTNDPFASGIVPSQATELTADSSVSRFTLGGFPPILHNNYNFALARVRLRGASSGTPSNTRVFFRLWSTQTADTGFDPTSTYLSNTAGGFPRFPEAPPDSHTIPFFATGNNPDLTNPANPEYGTSGINSRPISVPSGASSIIQYFGCFLNVYDPSNVVNGSAVQALLAGSHHCLVAQIANDDAPIVNANGVVETPENSDKLAQRNTNLVFIDNPGPADTHRAPLTFDLKPGQAVNAGAADLQNYPDELMIDWGKTPAGTVAHIYWPQISVKDVLALANRLYGAHLLSASDPNTISTTVITGVTYVPIPAGATENIAGLLTLDLPMSVRTGQEFNVVVRRVSTRSVPAPPQINIATSANPQTAAPKSATRQKSSVGQDPAGNPPGDPSKPRTTTNWRYVTGTFQAKIPVTTNETMLRPDEDALAVTKWRLDKIPATSRWAPIFKRHVSYLSARVAALGGDPDKIPPSPDGAPKEIFREGRGTLEVRFTDKSGAVVNDVADIFLKHLELSDARVIRRWPTNQVLVVPYLISTNTGIYSLQVLPDHHEEAGRFVTIREAADTDVTLVLEDDDD